MASQPAFQVLTKQGLSKPYSISSLASKKRQGLIDDSVECTHDGGLTFTRLGQLLQTSTKAQQPSLKKLKSLKPKQQLATLHSTPTSSDAPPPSGDLWSTDPENEISRPPQRVEDTGVAEPVPHDKGPSEAPPKKRRLPLQLPPPPAQPAPVSSLFETEFPSAPAAEPMVEPKIQPAPIGDAAKPPRLSVAEAAAAAVRAAERASQKQEAERRQQAEKEHLDHAATFEDDALESDFESPRPRGFLKTIATTAIILTGIAAAGLMTWQHFDAENSFDLSALADAQFAAFQDSSGNPATLEEVAARTQIMSLQIRQLSRAVGRQNPDALPAKQLEFSQADDPAGLPLLPYHPTQLSDEQQAESSAKLERYAKFVREQGPDGRKLDQTSVELYSRHLSDVMLNVSASKKNRTEALRELAELAKVLYLLQLGNITSSDPTRLEDAKSLLLKSTNAALHALFAELETGDMRFYDVYQAAEPEEQAELLLIRYWFHRASNRTAADAWLQEMVDRMNASQTATVQQSIAEANQIEQ